MPALRKQRMDLTGANNSCRQKPVSNGRRTGPRQRSSEDDHRSLDDESSGLGRARRTIPHPDEFSDGKKRKFEEWHLRMIDKLGGNADHFEDEQAKIRYIRSRLSGDAYTHVY